MTTMPIKTLTNYSPNFSTYKRNIKSVKYLVYHYTGMRSESKAINRLTDDKSKVSCHYFIKRNGSIIIMVPDLYEAWHAGKSNWKKDKALNKKSIGIEISNNGHQFGYKNYSKKQIKSLIKLSKYLIKKYKIKNSNILGHSDISFDRKKDPGEKFPWQHLSKKKIGFWHNIDKKKLKRLRNKEIPNSDKVSFFKFLFKIGYFKNILRKKKKNLLVKSFQRRYRQKLINGKIDLECLLIAKTLSKIS